MMPDSRIGFSGTMAMDSVIGSSITARDRGCTVRERHSRLMSCRGQGCMAPLRPQCQTHSHTGKYAVAVRHYWIGCPAFEAFLFPDAWRDMDVMIAYHPSDTGRPGRHPHADNFAHSLAGVLRSKGLSVLTDIEEVDHLHSPHAPHASPYPYRYI